ncbi:MAG: hypothetical protein COA69_04485 [Robiginitomaculum sp.]|nr:MAG: hypothetical protein COA69_04485 [Robiginitomaculum sp.]
MKDLHSNILLASIACAVLAADNTPVAIDLQGHNSAELLLQIGVGGITFSPTNKIEVVVTHSDDDATYIPVVDQDILGGTVADDGIIKSLIAAHAAAAAYRFGYPCLHPCQYGELTRNTSTWHFSLMRNYIHGT